MRYIGTFNYQREIHTFRAAANNKSQAYNILTRVLAKKLGLLHSTITRYFNGDNDNFEIREEKQ